MTSSNKSPKLYTLFTGAEIIHYRLEDVEEHLADLQTIANELRGLEKHDAITLICHICSVKRSLDSTIQRAISLEEVCKNIMNGTKAWIIPK